MSPSRDVRSLLLIVLAFLCGKAVSPAFSLLGPYANWMDQTNGYRQYGDIGGPMNIGQAYRWNVPIITYAFDQSFLDFFGSNGVSAIEHAIAILNRLPRASSIVLTNYQLETIRENYTAEAQNLCDLKSVALSALVQHLGLAAPTKYVYAIRRWNPMFATNPYEDSWYDSWFPDYLIRRNFDPKTFAASRSVNGTAYTGYVFSWTNIENVVFADVNDYPRDPLADWDAAVADRTAESNVGFYYTDLTGDDVGGLRYLLRTNTVNYEVLLADVHGVEPPVPPQPPSPPFRLPRRGPPPPPPAIPHRFVNGALRPGVEKVTFVRQSYNAKLNKASPLTYHYTDTYLTNGVVHHQQLERKVTQPDFLFSAAEPPRNTFWPAVYTRTGTTNWWNSAAASTNADRTGPGVIRPPVKISFTKLRPSAESYAFLSPAYSAYAGRRMGSFDGTTNAPIIYPKLLSSADTNHLTIRLWLETQLGTPPGGFTWRLPLVISGTATLQVSSNLVDWVPVFTVVNEGLPFDWYDYGSLPQRFFRVVPQ